MSENPGFALWLTGLPASGKSSITGELVKQLRSAGIPVVVLESDVMREIFTPEPVYREEERDRFYFQMVLTGELITRNQVNVIFDATANKRVYRTWARERIARFCEIYVQSPLEVCMKRDPKGIYRRAVQTGEGTVPGLQSPYEEPLNPEIIVDGTASLPSSSGLIFNFIKQRHYI